MKPEVPSTLKVRLPAKAPTEQITQLGRTIKTAVLPVMVGSTVGTSKAAQVWGFIGIMQLLGGLHCLGQFAAFRCTFIKL